MVIKPKPLPRERAMLRIPVAAGGKFIRRATHEEFTPDRDIWSDAGEQRRAARRGPSRAAR